MNIDELKQNWNSMDFTAGGPMPDVRDLEKRVATSRVSTLRDRIYRLHIRLSILACLGIFTMVPFEKGEPWMALCAIAFFIIMMAMHASLAFWAHKLDYGRMTVKEALKSVYELEHKRNRNRVIAVVMAIPLLCYMGYTFSNGEPGLLVGCIAGACLGALIGLMVNHRAVMTLREMKKELGDD
ncbi:MAG: hypothetical protein K2J65_01470 [Duncaniella sp.]|nr:hypothetical protein [Duncaniella sp.]